RSGFDILRAVMVAAVLISGERAARGEDVAVDLELVLAVDVSLSMDQDEQMMQLEGYVAAFRHPDVIDAIRSGLRGRIAVIFVEWGGVAFQQVKVPWTLIDGEKTAHAFADALSGRGLTLMPRTSLSDAIDYAAGLFHGNGFSGLRRVIDISGDGPNNQGTPVTRSRDRAVAKGITINGLPILLRPGESPGFFGIPNLDVYYEDCVIGGTGSFLVPVRRRANFTEAIRRKLILEIAGPAPRLLRASQRATPRVDCLIGEKLWDQWLDGLTAD
ncbi:MAG: DUF1194 domain-containing protein, partial [Alphaproteobacteria bacterium]